MTGLTVSALGGRRDAEAFLRLEKRVYGRRPVRFTGLERLLRAAAAGGSRLFLARRDGAAAAGMLVRKAGDTAYFSAFEALPDLESAQALFEEASLLAARLGCSRLVGPVPGDDSGFGIGLQVEGDADLTPWHPHTPAYYPSLLEGCGLRETQRFAALRRPLAFPYAGAAAFAERHGMEVTVVPLARRAVVEQAWAVCGDARPAGRKRFFAVCGRIAELAPKAFAVLAVSSGAPVGWLLCAPSQGTARVLQMQIRPEARRSPCAAALLDALCEETDRRGLAHVAAGTIDTANEASLRMARNAGLRQEAAWSVYAMSVGGKGPS